MGRDIKLKTIFQVTNHKPTNAFLEQNSAEGNTLRFEIPKKGGRNLVMVFGEIVPLKFFLFHPPTTPNTIPIALGFDDMS